MAHANKVAIIMDGNRRWAKKNNLPASSGHRKGIETLIEIVKSAKQNNVKCLCFNCYKSVILHSLIKLRLDIAYYHLLTFVERETISLNVITIYQFEELIEKCSKKRTCVKQNLENTKPYNYI